MASWEAQTVIVAVALCSINNAAGEQQVFVIAWRQVLFSEVK